MSFPVVVADHFVRAVWRTIYHATLRGTASIVARKSAGGDWQIQLVHGALEQKVAGITQ
jgi:hypothetical protein